MFPRGVTTVTGNAAYIADSIWRRLQPGPTEADPRPLVLPRLQISVLRLLADYVETAGRKRLLADLSARDGLDVDDKTLRRAIDVLVELTYVEEVERGALRLAAAGRDYLRHWPRG